jgi:transposase InsO family protein
VKGYPTFDTHAAKIDTVLSDNGREFCGRPDQHPYELFLQLEEIEHRTTRVKRPQSNGMLSPPNDRTWSGISASCDELAG